MIICLFVFVKCLLCRHAILLCCYNTNAILSLLQLLLYVTAECLTLLPFVQEDSKFDSLPGTGG